MTLNEWLRKHGLRKADLARQLGVTRGTITKWCKGDSDPTTENWREIARLTKGEVTPNDHILGLGLTGAQRTALPAALEASEARNSSEILEATDA